MSSPIYYLMVEADTGRVVAGDREIDRRGRAREGRHELIVMSWGELRAEAVGRMQNAPNGTEVVMCTIRATERYMVTRAGGKVALVPTGKA